MSKLEYRLFDEAGGYPVLYYYSAIKPEEAGARFACDYFTKESTVYEKTSCAIEPETNVIYVKAVQSETALAPNPRSTVGMGYVILELREFDEQKNYPLIQSVECPNLNELILYLQSDFITVSGVEWERSSTEVDEDRQVYVLYVKKPTEGNADEYE